MTFSTRASAGFSLTELVAVLAVMAILVGAGVPVIVRSIEISEEKQTRSRIESIAAGLEAFYRDHGRLPTNGESLDALIIDPGTAQWRGPYLVVTRTTAETLSDARGGRFVYEPNGTQARVSTPQFPEIEQTVEMSALVAGWRVRARDELGLLNDAAERFRADAGRYPNGVDELVPGWIGADYGTDPWGSDYYLSGTTFASPGPDGQAGNADDVYPAGLGTP